jgi:HD-GYP domain-containing protein (c-di-GMP phosphodiesterase class II)
MKRSGSHFDPDLVVLALDVLSGYFPNEDGTADS